MNRRLEDRGSFEQEARGSLFSTGGQEAPPFYLTGGQEFRRISFFNRRLGGQEASSFVTEVTRHLLL
jgi:hypothetical protein